MEINSKVHTTASVASVSLSVDYVHDIPNMCGKAAAQVLFVLSVVQKRSNLYSNVLEPAGPMLVQQDLETDPHSN